MITTLFNVGDLVEHKKGGKYVIVQVPETNKILEYNREPFYVYTKNDDDPVQWHRCISEMEDGRFKKVSRKVSIQKQGMMYVGGMFEDFDCVRDFLSYPDEVSAIEDARAYFGTDDFEVVRPVITKIRMS